MSTAVLCGSNVKQIWSTPVLPVEVDNLMTNELWNNFQINWKRRTTFRIYFPRKVGRHSPVSSTNLNTREENCVIPAPARASGTDFDVFRNRNTTYLAARCVIYIQHYFILPPRPSRLSPPLSSLTTPPLLSLTNPPLSSHPFFDSISKQIRYINFSSKYKIRK